MNRNEFKKMLPSVEEQGCMAGLSCLKSKKEDFNSDSYYKGLHDALDYLIAKFPDFTKEEMKAIELYESSKLCATNHLYNNSNRTYEECEMFLNENQNKTSEYFKMAMAIYKESVNGLLKTVCEHLYNSGRSQEYSNNELAEIVEQFLKQNQ